MPLSTVERCVAVGKHLQILERKAYPVEPGHGKAAVPADGGQHLFGVAAGDEFGYGAQLLAVLGAERLELRLKAVLYIFRSVVRNGHLLDVELLEHYRLFLFGKFERPFGDHHHLGKGLAVFEVARVARRATVHHDAQHVFHSALEPAVYERFVGLGEAAEMHGYGCVLIELRHEIAVHHLGNEGRIWRRHLCQRHEHGVQRGVGGGLVLRHVAAPEAVAAAADVPV